MKIIQERTKLENLKKVRQMRLTFDDENSDYNVELRFRRDMRKFKNLSWLVLALLGILSVTVSLQHRWGSLGLLQWASLILLLAESIGLYLFYYIRIWKSDHSAVMNRFDEKDYFIYWLLVDDRDPRVILTSEQSSWRKKFHPDCLIIRPSLIGKARLSAFTFKGEGVEVDTVNLDDNEIILSDLKGDIDIGTI
ncbi:MAG: hypothetical protein K6A92_06975 [Lachnospiraceae bacterium]|nr:hypothetical protein [Lachnospiraceae bacterium]